MTEAYEFDPTRPIYLQIMEEIKKRSVRGQYAPGSKLPSVREMSKAMGVNPNTIGRAYMELEREKFVISKRGQGSYLAEELDRIEKERTRLADKALRQFVSEIGGLELDSTEMAGLLEKLLEELGHD